jgi:leucyl-tRNA synthetase
MFMGPLADSKPWNPRDVPGCRRFLERAWRLFVDPEGQAPLRPHLAQTAGGAPAGAALELERALNRAIKRVDDSFQGFNFNTAVAALMTFVNEATKAPEALRRDQAERFLLALAPFAPHFSEELWARLGHRASLAREAWPKVQPQYLEDDTIELVVQVLGKLRGKVQIPKSLDEAGAIAAARGAVPQWLEGKDIVKTVYVPGRLINFVVR